MKKHNYLSPSVQVTFIQVEKGFAATDAAGYAPEGEAGTLVEGNTYTW